MKNTNFENLVRVLFCQIGDDIKDIQTVHFRGFNEEAAERKSKPVFLEISERALPRAVYGGSC